LHHLLLFIFVLFLQFLIFNRELVQHVCYHLIMLQQGLDLSVLCVVLHVEVVRLLNLLSKDR